MSNLSTYIRAPSTVSCVWTLSTNCDFRIFSSPKIKATSWSLVVRIPEIHHVVPWFSQHFIAVKCFLSSMASSGISHFATERTYQQHGVAGFVAAAATNPVYFGMWSTNQRTTISIWRSLTYRVWWLRLLTKNLSLFIHFYTMVSRILLFQYLGISSKLTTGLRLAKVV